VITDKILGITVPDHVFGTENQPQPSLIDLAVKLQVTLKEHASWKLCYHISYIDVDIKKGKLEVCGQKL
jgi:hypothetical protein